MKLSQQLEGKKVRLIAVDNEEFIGIVADYIYPDDNEPEGLSGIILDDCPKRDYPIRFNEDEIKSITIIS